LKRFRALPLLPLSAALLSIPGSAVPAQQELPISGDDVPGLGAFDGAMAGLLYSRNVPGGALAVMKDGRLVYNRAFGWADKEASRAWSTSTLCRTASISKVPTAMAIMTLAQNGKISLDDPDTPAGVAPFLKQGAVGAAPGVAQHLASRGAASTGEEIETPGVATLPRRWRA
jgi:CubicO group peptidase (beta-lactamase class C family)